MNRKKTSHYYRLMWIGTMIVTLGNPLPLGFGAEPFLDSGPPTSSESDAPQEVSMEAALNNKISLDVEEEEISNILKGISKAFQLNIVSTQTIAQRVTLSLRDVAIRDVLDAVFAGSDYTYQIRGNVINIVSLKEEISTEVFDLSYSKASEVRSSIESLLSKSGALKVDDTQNRIIVSDYPAQLKEIQDTIRKFDAPTPQVLIEAKLVDVSDTDLSAFGVSWRGNTNLEGTLGGVDKAPLTERTVTIPGSTTTTTTSADSQDWLLSMAEPFGDIVTGGQGKIEYGLTANRNVFNLALNALIKKNKAHLLASPSITTLNNQEAKIIIGEKVPFRESNLTSAGTTETTKFVDVGITLRVTPRVGRDDYITLDLQPAVSSVSDLLDAGPRITTREATTKVMVKNGQTVVIAGLIRNDNTVITQKIPILGSLPLFGLLFRNKGTKLLTTELAVFVTPYLIRPGAPETEAPPEDAISPVLFYNRGFRLMGDTGVESFGKTKDQRLREAAAMFELIVRRYPDSDQADDAYYYIGKIAYESLKDYPKAAQAWGVLKERYPESEYVDFGFSLKLRRAKRLAKKQAAAADSAGKTTSKNVVQMPQLFN